MFGLKQIDHYSSALSRTAIAEMLDATAEGRDALILRSLGDVDKYYVVREDCPADCHWTLAVTGNVRLGRYGDGTGKVVIVAGLTCASLNRHEFLLLLGGRDALSADGCYQAAPEETAAP